MENIVAGPIETIIVNGLEIPIPLKKMDQEQLIAWGCKLQKAKDQIDEELGEVKELAGAEYEKELQDSGKKSLKKSGVAGSLEISLKQNLKIVDHGKLKKILEQHELKFSDYVRFVQEYKDTKKLRQVWFEPNEKLIKLIVDGDQRKFKKLRDMIEVVAEPKEYLYIRFIPRD